MHTAICTCKKCGSEFEKYGWSDNWSSWAPTYFDLCPSCYNAQKREKRETENKEAAEESKTKKWPEMSGTPKQAAWAIKIKRDVINEYEKEIENIKDKIQKSSDGNDKESLQRKYDEKMCYLQLMIERNDCDAWIPYAYDKPAYACRALVSEMYAQNYDIKNKMFVARPENITHDNFIKIYLLPSDGFEYVAVFNDIVGDDGFKTIMTDKLMYFYSGEDKSYLIEVDNLNGTYANLAAETGNALLNAGYSVCFEEKEIMDMAVSGNFKKKITKWVYANDDDLVIKTRHVPNSDRMYDVAKTLPGATYYKNGYISGVSVKVGHYKEIYDFADKYGYQLTDRAKAKIDKYIAATKVVVPVKKEKQEKNKKELIKTGGIIEDLIDD